MVYVIRTVSKGTKSPSTLLVDLNHVSLRVQHSEGLQYRHGSFAYNNFSIADFYLHPEETLVLYENCSSSEA